MIRQIYLDIATRLLSIPNAAQPSQPALKWIDLYNSQPEYLGDTPEYGSTNRELSIFFPCVLIDIGNIDYYTDPKQPLVQQGTVSLTLYVGQEYTTDSFFAKGQAAVGQAHKLTRFDLLDAVYYTLENYSTASFKPLLRTAQTVDNRHSNLIWDTIEFRLLFTDCIAQQQAPPPITVAITPDNLLINSYDNRYQQPAPEIDQIITNNPHPSVNPLPFKVTYPLLDE